EFGAGDDGHLPGMRRAADALGVPRAGAATECAARLAAAGLLPEYAGGLRCIRRGPGALGGVAGQRHAVADASGDVRGGGVGGELVAVARVARADQLGRLWWCGAGGAG